MINYIEVRGTDRKLLAIIQNFTSLIWRTEYNGAGAFELVVPYTQEYFEILQPDNYITRVDSTEIGFIESVKMQYSVTEGRLIVVSGRFGLVLLERRIWADLIAASYKCVLNKTTGTNAADMTKQIVNQTLVNPDWTNRVISWLSMGTFSLAETAEPHESTYQNVLELTRKILNEALLSGSPSALGQRIKFDRETLNATYQVYKGLELNLAFSQKYKNLNTFNFEFDKTLYKSAFLVAGDGEGASRFYTHHNRNAADGEEKRREFCFESGLSKTYNDSNGNEQTYSNAQYATNLINDCRANFGEHSSQIKISGTVNLSAYKLGVDYDVGDVVKIVDDETAISTNARIWAVNEVQDKNGYMVEADFEGGI